jgi:hypothetical protein
MENNTFIFKLCLFLFALSGYVRFLIVVLRGKKVLNGKDGKPLTRVMAIVDITFGVLSIYFCYYLKACNDLYILTLFCLYLLSIIASWMRTMLGISKLPKFYRVLYNLASNTYIVISIVAISKLVENIIELPFSSFLVLMIFLGTYYLVFFKL